MVNAAGAGEENLSEFWLSLSVLLSGEEISPADKDPLAVTDIGSFSEQPVINSVSVRSNAVSNFFISTFTFVKRFKQMRHVSTERLHCFHTLIVALNLSR